MRQITGPTSRPHSQFMRLCVCLFNDHLLSTPVGAWTHLPLHSVSVLLRVWALEGMPDPRSYGASPLAIRHSVTEAVTL